MSHGFFLSILPASGVHGRVSARWPLQGWHSFDNNGRTFLRSWFWMHRGKNWQALTIGTVLDDETIRCVSPMMPPGKYDIEVSFNGISFHPLTIESGGPKAAPFKFIVGDIIIWKLSLK